MRTYKHWIVATILAGLTLWLAPSPDTESEKSLSVVKYVIDGDTFILKDSETRIRLWGVDATEREEAGYQKSKDNLATSFSKTPQLTYNKNFIPPVDNPDVRFAIEQRKKP